MNSLKLPLVSVLIPTYNREGYLEESLRSAVEQSYENLEIIVSDNCSTDATLDIAHAMAAEDKRIQVHSNDTNLGMVGNFRRCFELSKGPYIKYLMSDDRLHSNAVERLLAALLQEPSLALATSVRSLIDANGNPLPAMSATQPVCDDDSIIGGTEFGDYVLVDNLNVIGEPTTVLWRRSLAKNSEICVLNGRPYHFNADVALWLLLLSRGNAGYIVEPLSDFRYHPEQAQKDGEAISSGTLEWLHLIRDAHQLGYVAQAAAEVQALTTFLLHATKIVQLYTEHPNLHQLTRGMVEASERLGELVHRSQVSELQYS